MALRSKRSPIRRAQLRDRKRARRRHRQRRAEAPTKPFDDRLGKGEAEKSRRLRLGRQQLRHDRRRRRGQANHDPAARSGSNWLGFFPAGGDGQRYDQGAKPRGRRK